MEPAFNIASKTCEELFPGPAKKTLQQEPEP
jgi:hypothetical protein